jgi:hypothetical protein
MESVYNLKNLATRVLQGYRLLDASGNIIYSESDIILELESRFDDIRCRIILMEAKSLGIKYGFGSLVYIVIASWLYIQNRENAWYLGKKRLEKRKREIRQSIEEKREKLVVSDMERMIESVAGGFRIKLSPLEDGKELSRVMLEMFIRGLEENRNPLQNVEVKRVEMKEDRKYVMKEGIVLESSCRAEGKVRVVIYIEVFNI